MRILKLTSLLAVSALCAAACSGDEAGSTTTMAEETAGEVITVTGTDFAFQDLPETIESGTQLVLDNASDTELHELVAFRLSDDESRSVDELAQLSPEELEATLGAPAAVLLAPPGDTSFPAIGTAVLSEPGRYAIFCFIPTGVDPDVYLEAAEGSDGPPQVDGGPPHFVNGMLGEVTVEG